MRNIVLTFALAASVVVTGCSPPIGDARREEVRAEAGVSTEADRRAAALLSLSNNSTLEAKKDPYELALACLVALDSLQERLNEMQALNNERRNALRLARSLYERKASTSSAKSAAELANDIHAERAASENQTLQAQVAISCLRKLT